MLIEKPLVASKITIRDYSKTDLPFITAMWFDEENGKYMIDPTEAYVNEEYRQALNELEDNPEGYYLTVVQTGSDNVIGSCCIFPNKNKDSYDIGYCINKKYWRQGYGTELIQLVIDWVRDRGGVEITAEVAKDNAGSNALLRKFGFEVIRETNFKKYNMDVTFDSYIYRLNLK